ncbi:MAG: serine/threonine protein kinase [Steroidobacteraceae bacterium]
MNLNRLVLIGIAVAGLAACEGGGVNLNVSTVDNSVDNSTNNSGGGGTNPCAAYTPQNSNEVRRGNFDGTNCIYDSTFVGAANPMLVDLTIPFISGKHIFQDSLFIGQNVSSGAAPASGTGPKLTIAAGNTLVFQDAADYVLINRGSQILANGSPTAPITFTSFTDAISGTAGANDVQQWGGMVINGNGITNNCSDAERANNQCHVVSEGQPSNYGGSDNADNSGVLRYVIVKHTGFEVAPGDELNGITFNAVGSGTTVENIQVYSTYDDGLEFFGGAVDVNNVVVLYARDDSLDYSDGYVGTIENALIIHWQTDGNGCVEGDNVGSGRTAAGVSDTLAPVSEPTIRNMTCILSNNDAGTHGDSEGLNIRQGGRLVLEDSIIYGGYGNLVNGRTSNECYDVSGTGSLAAAVAGTAFAVVNTVNACEELLKMTLPNGDAATEWWFGANPSTSGANYSFNTGNFAIADSDNANASVLVAGGYATAANIVDDAGVTLRAGAGLGAVQAGNDWTSPWAFGLRTANADQPLWFAP